MELTDKNIAQLYQFTQDHYVDWYDLQTELVDHLANDIEEIWKENPSISFEKARDISFKKFGIFGFGEIVEKKQNALSKQYWLMIWKEFKSFFKLPKIILTLFFMVGTYYLFSFFNNSYFIFSLFLISMAVLPIYKAIVVVRKMKSRAKKTKKKWLIDGALFHSGIYPYIVLCPWVNITDLFLRNSPFTTNQLLFLSITFVTFNLLFYISTEIVRPKVQKKMTEQFPEYALG